MELKGLDSYLVSGRYRREWLLVTCDSCGEHTVVEAEQEYGSVWWTPEECKNCGDEFGRDTKFEEYYPDEEVDYD